MRALVVYESIYGNTHAIADAVAHGLSQWQGVRVLSVEQAWDQHVSQYQLVVVGGPTHAHGMSRPGSRRQAIAWAALDTDGASLDPSAAGAGVREWLEALNGPPVKAAAFDTREDIPALFAGRASAGIARALRRKGFPLIAQPQSFLVKGNRLEPGETERAQAWGAVLAGKVQSEYF